MAEETAWSGWEFEGVTEKEGEGMGWVKGCGGRGLHTYPLASLIYTAALI